MTTQARRALPWFRLYAEFAGDPVVQSLAFEDQRHFIVLLCLKCDGTLDRPISKKTRERIICRGLGLDPVTAGEANRRLVEVGLISENWQPNGWENRQFISDNSTERVRKYRNNKKTGNVTETSGNSFGNGPDTDTDTDIDTNVSIGHSDKPNAVSRVVVPYQKILDLYHEILPDNPPAIPSRWTINPAHKDLRNRWKEAERHQDMDFWQAFFIAVSKVPRWVEGIPSQNGGKPWRPDLPWLLRSRNFEKVLSEMVDNKRRNGHG